MKSKNEQNSTSPDLNKAIVSSGFEHYMIYVNGKFEREVYSFEEVQDYYNKYHLYGKITYEKVT